MSLPYFFSEQISAAGAETILDEESSKHIVQVLRMEEGEKLLLTDGAGTTAVAEIIKAHKKHCTVNINAKEFKERELPELTIAISLIKNASRFEWFLEKATELGTAGIIPMICERTEKQHSRHDRFLNIVKSAMLQSSQCWMPRLHEPVKFTDVVAKATQEKKYIGHLLEEDKQLAEDKITFAKGNKRMLSEVFDASIHSHIILIGPEGDFSPTEIKLAVDKQFIPVSMGKTTLRVETAGLYAAAVCR